MNHLRFIAAAFALLAFSAIAQVSLPANLAQQVLAAPSSTLTECAPNISAAKLIDYYHAPAPVVLTNNQADLESMARDFIAQNNINAKNQYAAFVYAQDAHNWESRGRDVTKLPTPPVYWQFNEANFAVDWTQYVALVKACSIDASDSRCSEPAELFNNTVSQVAPLPAPVILPACPQPVLAPGASPIGAYNGANIYMVAPGDAHKDGDIYSDSTGTYQKHVYITPFGTTQLWYKLS